MVTNLFANFSDRKYFLRKKINENTTFIIRNDSQDELVINEIWEQNQYSPSGFKIEDKFTVVDIGACAGTFAVYAAQKAKYGKVYAYEPEKENFEILKKNVEINRLKNVKLFNLTVLDKTGKTEFFIGEKGKTGTHSVFLKTPRAVLVNKISLKDIFDENHIKFCDFIKIDTEGSEYEILRNLPKEYWQKIGMIILEYHDFARKNELKNIISTITLHGFKITSLKSSCSAYGILAAKRLKTYSPYFLKYCNYIQYFTLKPKLKIESFFRRIDFFLGQIGLFMKKHCPYLYFKLKNIKIKP